MFEIGWSYYQKNHLLSLIIGALKYAIRKPTYIFFHRDF